MRGLCYSFCQLPQKVSPKSSTQNLPSNYKTSTQKTSVQKFQAPTPTPTILIISDLNLQILHLFISCFIFNQEALMAVKKIFHPIFSKQNKIF